jgi:hypothetical protein
MKAREKDKQMKGGRERQREACTLRENHTRKVRKKEGRERDKKKQTKRGNNTVRENA